MHNITVFGAGYVGLVQSAVLADVGNKVLCVDIDEDKLRRIESGVIPFHEPGLSSLVTENIAAGRLSFTSSVADGVAFANIIFIAVGTPSEEYGSADLKHVMAVATSIGDEMSQETFVILKSTVPVGTCEMVEATIKRSLVSRGLDFYPIHVVSNPEFLKEGSAVSDCQRPDRIVIGTTSRMAESVMRNLYAPFNRNREKIIAMDSKSAEMTKYAANCMLATKISFMNEMAAIAEKTGADIEAVRRGIGSDPRIGYDFIYAGAGYGGSCLPKDVRALIATAESVGVVPGVLHAIQERNDLQKHSIYEKMVAHFDGQIGGKTIALWGLSFKPNTDDMREAPSRVLIQQLRDAGARVQAFDPEAMAEAKRIYGDVEWLILSGSKEAALEGADALVVMTEWQNFKSPDFIAIKRLVKTPVIFDGRNLFDPHLMEHFGIPYYSIGRAPTLRSV